MKQPVKIAVIAHVLRTAGGLSVGRDLIDGITRVAPENHYLFLIPEGPGYEERCERAPGAEIRMLPEMNIFNEKIMVAGPSVPDSMRQIPKDIPTPTAFEGHENQLKLFCPARYYPHKNLEILTELFSQFPDELSNVTVFITLTADHHPNAAKLLAKIDRLNLRNKIVNLGHIPYEEIGSYYRHSDALFMPSLLESFSTTYVEAMAAGLPILTSDLDFAHSACGDAAEYFNPFDPASVQNSIVRFMNDHARQTELAQLGEQKMQSEITTWDDIANTVIDNVIQIAVGNT